MNNQEIAELLYKVAIVYDLLDENRFKIIAYKRAAETIEHHIEDIENLWKEGKLYTISGIGKAIGSSLEELFKTGKVKHFQNLLKKIPSSVFPLLKISGLGPKKAYKLVKELKLYNSETIVDDLLECAKRGKIATIDGFGNISQNDIIESLKRYKVGQKKELRIPLSYAYDLAMNIVDYLKRCTHTIEVSVLGSLRRNVETIGDIDIAVSTNDSEKVLEWFVKYPSIEKIIENGTSSASILLKSHHQIDLRVCSPERFGAMIQYFTGSKNHNIQLREHALKMGLSLSEYGIKVLKKNRNSQFKAQSKVKLRQNYNSKLKIYQYSQEKDFYNALGLPWIPPEIREGSGEIEAAFLQSQGKLHGLPKLVQLTDIKGDLHIHSNYNLKSSHDLGSSSLEQIIAKAAQLKYEYIGISDHNPSYTNHNSKDIVQILKERKDIFEQIYYSTKSTRVHLFIMLEVDILSDGSIPIPVAAMPYIDAFIVSIHSSFNMDKQTMTNRIISGLSHPKAKILAHPSGRLLGKRDAYEVDWKKLMTFCKERDKAIEINSHPLRLDLRDELVKESVKYNIKLAINSDSHDISQMELLKYGISVAKRGWSEKSDIINCLSYNDIKKWLLN